MEWMVLAWTLAALVAAPTAPAVERLQVAIQRYASTAADGGFPRVSPGPTLERGSSSERVVALRARLRSTGDLASDPAPDELLFDEDTAAAVARFQARHGLASDGRVGGATLRALNVSVWTRLRTLELNLERWRALPADPGPRWILVNTAGAEVWAVEGETFVLRSRAITGRRSWPTPLLDDRVVAVEVNPIWHVPRRIAREEIVPHLVRDPGWAAERRLRVVDLATRQSIDPESVDWLAADAARFQFEQLPGPENPLGSLKLHLTNRLSVYLHGTSDPGRFERPSRHASHGCVRVEQIAALTRFVAGEALVEPIETALASGETQMIPLPAPVPVFLVYFTAWVDDDTTVQFRPDVYGLDAEAVE